MTRRELGDAGQEWVCEKLGKGLKLLWELDTGNRDEQTKLRSRDLLFSCNIEQQRGDLTAASSSSRKARSRSRISGFRPSGTSLSYQHCPARNELGILLAPPFRLELSSSDDRRKLPSWLRKRRIQGKGLESNEELCYVRRITLEATGGTDLVP